MYIIRNLFIHTTVGGQISVFADYAAENGNDFFKITGFKI